MKLSKELVDNLIYITQKYYRTGDTRVLDVKIRAGDKLESVCNVPMRITRLIEDLSRFSQRNGDETYEKIYKALEIFGVIVE